MRIFTTALKNKTIRQILNKNTSPYLHSVSLVTWPFTLMKRSHFGASFISRFSTYIWKVFSYAYYSSWLWHNFSLIMRWVRQSREKKMTGSFFHTKKSFPHDRQQYAAEVLKKPRRTSARAQALVMVKCRGSLNTIFTPIAQVLRASKRHVKIIWKASKNVIIDMVFNKSLKLKCKTSCKQACTAELLQWFVTRKTLKFKTRASKGAPNESSKYQQD